MRRTTFQNASRRKVRRDVSQFSAQAVAFAGAMRRSFLFCGISDFAEWAGFTNAVIM
jgi:hypothetical protein